MLEELRARAQELIVNRTEFTTLLGELDETQLKKPAGEEGYSAQEALAHLVGADVSMARMARNWIAGKDNRLRPDFDRDFFNRRQIEKRAGQSVQELLQDWLKAQDDLVALMETVTEQDLDKRGDHPSAKDTTLRNLFTIITRHEADHIRQVKEAVYA
jgi:hypothetical protein